MSLITYLTTIRFGRGVIAQLREDIAACGMTKPLVVTDKGVVASGLLAKLEAVMGGAAPAIFDGVDTNPTEAATLEALAGLSRGGLRLG